MKNTKKNTDNSNILLALMFIIILILLVYIIFFTGGNAKTDFYSDAIKFQNIVSNYIGKIESETFGAYEIENIVIGYNSDGIEIKDINEKNIISIADRDSKIEKNQKNYYKLNSENIKKVLNTEIPVYSGIEWYICEDGTLGIKITGKTPKWWNDSLDTLKIS